MLNLSKIESDHITLSLEHLIADINNKNLTIEKLNIYIENISDISDSYITSNEGIINRTIINILDFIRSLISSTIWNAKNVFKGINKKSALTVYELNKAIRINKILKLPYTKIYNVLVQNPPLEMLPLDNIKFIDDKYKKLNMIKISNMYLSYLTDFKAMISTESYKDVLDLKKSYKIDKKIGLTITKDITKKITIKIDKIPFVKLFNSMDIFKSYYNMIKEKNSIYDELDTIYKNMNTTKNEINNITELVENLQKISDVKKCILCLKYLIETSKAIAEDYEAFGLIIKIYSQIEYNIIQIFNVLNMKL